MKNIEKSYSVEDDCIAIALEDIRDEYTTNASLGRIGAILITNYGVSLIQQMDVYDTKKEKLREKKLYEAFQEIFGKGEYDPTSKEYYQKIMSMIETGELKNLGYEMKQAIDDYEEDILERKKPRFH